MQISFSRHLIQLSINSASKSRGFHGICRKSFLPRQVCFANLCGLVGERFSPTPPFFTLGGECRVIWFFPSGSRRRLCRLTCPPPAANSSSRFALRQRAFAALRSPASHLLLAPLLGAKEFVHNMVGVLGFEPRTSSLSGTRSNQLSYTPIQDYQSLSGCGLVKWWSRRDSNPQHPACKAGALAIELRPLAPKSCLPFGHGPQAPASRDRYFSGAPVGHW